MSVNRRCATLILTVLLLGPGFAAVGQPADGPRDGQPYLSREELTRKYDQDGNGELSPAER